MNDSRYTFVSLNPNHLHVELIADNNDFRKLIDRLYERWVKDHLDDKQMYFKFDVEVFNK